MNQTERFYKIDQLISDRRLGFTVNRGMAARPAPHRWSWNACHHGDAIMTAF